MASARRKATQPPDMKLAGKAVAVKQGGKEEVQSRDDNQAWFSEPTSPLENSAVDKVRAINRQLVFQIETLRLKIDVDSRQHERSKKNLISSTNAKLKTRELEIENLKSELQTKETKVKELHEKNEEKESEVQQLQRDIDELKEDVIASKTYADEIQNQFNELQREKYSLETGTAYKEKDDKIQELQHELVSLKRHLQTLERELAGAKEKIAKQGGKLRLVDNDRTNMQLRFKEELARINQTMRLEIERMRDTMKEQWEEMRELRKQNEGMRTDIKEIRELLVAEAQMENQSAVRGYVHSPFNLQPLNPSLPTLSRDTHRIVSGRKKF